MLAESSDAELKLFCYEGDGTVPLRTLLRERYAGKAPPASISLVIGAEGGFSLAEVEKAKEAGEINDEYFANSVDIIMQELRKYREEHKMYENFRVAKGQKVIPLLLLMDDFDEVVGLFEKYGLHIHIATMKDSETLCIENLESI